MVKLKDYKNELGVVRRGTVFRCPNYRGSGEYVHFMLFETIGSENSVHGLVYTTGYDAGYPFIHFPKEACSPGTKMLSLDWLQEHWAKYVYDDKPFEEIEVVGKYNSEMKVERFVPIFD